MVMTVGSVVPRPDDGVVWVGTGEAPTSHGAIFFSLGREGHAPEHGVLEADGATAFCATGQLDSESAGVGATVNTL